MEDQDRYTACFTAVKIINKNGFPASDTWANQDFTTINRKAENWLHHFFNFGNCLPLPSVMVKRADLVKLDFFRASLIQLGDLDLWIRLSALGDFFILPEQLTKIRIIDGINLSEPTIQNYRQAQIELATILERYTESPIIEKFNCIFPGYLKLSGQGARKVALALRAWDHGSSAHLLFADRTVAQVMENHE